MQGRHIGLNGDHGLRAITSLPAHEAYVIGRACAVYLHVVSMLEGMSVRVASPSASFTVNAKLS